ncbi:MAG: protein tyrosine phosphatase family protein [Dehalococcoidia bacterium]
MAIEDIRNFRRFDDRLVTGGQPTEEQLRDLAAAGFEAVVNIATINPRYSLPDEPGLVESLGMAYHHIPVEWESPQVSDFEAFEHVMAGLEGRRMLIHCAANYRVTAFTSLWARRNLRWTPEQAAAFRAAVWDVSEYPAWAAFVASIEASTDGA